MGAEHRAGAGRGPADPGVVSDRTGGGLTAAHAGEVGEVVGPAQQGAAQCERRARQERCSRAEPQVDGPGRVRTFT